MYPIYINDIPVAMGLLVLSFIAIKFLPVINRQRQKRRLERNYKAYLAERRKMIKL